MLTLVIPGKPVAKARPRFFRRGNFVGTYKPDKEATEEGKFIILAKEQLRSQGLMEPLPPGVPVLVSYEFTFEIPKSYSQKRRAALMGTLHTKKPDTDNLIKFIKDALNRIAWTDDAQVAAYGHTLKKWGASGQTLITFEPLPPGVKVAGEQLNKD